MPPLSLIIIPVVVPAIDVSEPERMDLVVEPVIPRTSLPPPRKRGRLPKPVAPTDTSITVQLGSDPAVQRPKKMARYLTTI